MNNSPKDKSIFISPVKIPLSLSSNFGELRIDHFHSGLDIKTQGVSGKEVVATADGFIYRISVSPGGFGKALYIRHSSGYSSVYGHLERFTPEIEKYVEEKQYENKSYLVTLYPTSDRFPVKQGDLIAFSGNSGSSTGPHLHFEIRRSENEVPVNPLKFDFGLADNIEPVIEKLVIYPVNRYSLINNQSAIKMINVTGSHGNYSVPAGNEIHISGAAGFGIKSYDLLNNSNNKCEVYSISLAIDKVEIFSYIMDSFSFNESRFIDSHIDYALYMKDHIYVERTFVLPNDKLSVYRNLVDRGIFNFNDDKIHNAVITLTDIHNNKSVLSFKIKSDPVSHRENSSSADKKLLMPYNRSNKFTSGNISVNIPSGALYDTIYFSYKNTPGTWDMLSDLHYVHNKYTPVHKTYSLSIKPRRIPAGKESKMLIVQLDDDHNRKALNSTWDDGYLKTEAASFGNFYVGIDTVAPLISAIGLVPGSDLTGKKEIRIRINDDFSGIKSYVPVIDGDWALFEYDQKNNIIIYRFDRKRIKQGIRHSLSLKVTDNTDNVSFFDCNFKW